MAAVIERVDSLEQTVQDFVRSVGAEFRKLYNSQRQTEAELRLLKDEMRVFKDETRRQQREIEQKVGGALQQAGYLGRRPSRPKPTPGD